MRTYEATVKTWREISARQGRNDLPGLLAKHYVRLSPDDLRTAVADAWTMAEWPEQHLDAEVWAFLFEGADYQEDGRPGDVEALPEVVTLWRGATAGRRAGMSWTGRRETGEWFARRFSGTRDDEGTFLYRIDIPREFILARFSERRGEDEYVVDTAAFEDDEYVIEATYPATA